MARDTPATDSALSYVSGDTGFCFLQLKAGIYMRTNHFDSARSILSPLESSSIPERADFANYNMLYMEGVDSSWNTSWMSTHLGSFEAIASHKTPSTSQAKRLVEFWIQTKMKGDTLLPDSSGFSYRPFSIYPDIIETINTDVNFPDTADSFTSITICDGDSVFLNHRILPTKDSFTWTKNGTLLSDSCLYADLPHAVGGVPTTYSYKLTSWNTGGIDVDTSLLVVTVKPSPAACTGSDQSVCKGSGTSIGCTTVSGSKYNWMSVDTNITSSDTFSTKTISPDSTTTYYLREINSYGCGNMDSIVITVNPLPGKNAGADAGICIGSTTSIGASSVSGHSYSWSSSPSGLSSSISNPSVNPGITTTFILAESIDATGCADTDSVVITVNPLPTVATPDADPDPICLGQGTVISVGSVIGDSYNWKSDPAGFTLSGATTTTVYPTVTTMYIVTGTTDATGCSNSDSTLVVVNPLPTPYAGADADIEPEASVGIGYGGTDGDTYSWSSDPGGFSSSISNPVVTPDVSTTYYLTETSPMTGCSNVDTVVISVGEDKRSTGISSQSNKDGMKLSPNPFTDYFVLEFTEPSKEYSIEVLDLLGKTVLSRKNISGYQVRIDTKELAPASYLLLVTDGSGNISRYKMVKVKE